jgi:hypothetical protein
LGERRICWPMRFRAANNICRQRISVGEQLPDLSQVPEFFRAHLRRFAARLQQLAGDNSLAWTLYGPAITEPHPRHVIHSMLVLRGVDLDMLRRLAAEGPKYARIKLAPPLVTTPEFLKSSCDAFPLELIEVQQKNFVALGEDYFSGLKFEDRNVRLQCERELKVLLIGLRQGLLAGAGKERRMELPHHHWYHGLLRILRGGLWCKGTKDWLPAAAVLEAVGAHVKRPLVGVRHAVAATKPVDWPAFQNLYADVEALGTAVDGW